MLGHRLTLASLMMASAFGHGISMGNDIRLMAPAFTPVQAPPRTGRGFAAVKRAAEKRRNVLRNRAMRRGSRKRHG